MKKERRRSLSNVGGACIVWGDRPRTKDLAHCLDVESVDKLPFTHGFHAYPARMHPEIAKRVIENYKPKRVIDPFVGSGTTTLETVRAGLPFAGCDISRVALEIAWARTRVWVPDDCRRVEREGHGITMDARGGRLDTLPAWAEAQKEWYPEHTLEELCILKLLVDSAKPPDIRRILRVVLSSLIVKLSKQASDSTTAPDRQFRPWPRGATPRLFAEKSTELTKLLLSLSSDLYKRKVKPVEPDLRLADARTAGFAPTADDLVLTSPPYPGTYDYARHHRLRYPIFDETGEFAETHEIGARRDFDELRYREHMRRALKNCLPARMVVLIGDGARIHADRLLGDVAGEIGAKVIGGASQERADWSFGRERKMRREHLILIEPATTRK